MWKHLLPWKKYPFSLTSVQVFLMRSCHHLLKCNAFASPLHYLLLSCRLDCHTNHDLCHCILSASARLYIFKWCRRTLGKEMSVQTFYTCYTAEVGAACCQSHAIKCLSFSTSSWYCDLNTSLADRLFNAFKAFRTMLQEHFMLDRPRGEFSKSLWCVLQYVT